MGEIFDCAQLLGFQAALELDKAYCRDYWQRGRIRVCLFDADKKPIRDDISSRKYHLFCFPYEAKRTSFVQTTNYVWVSIIQHINPCYLRLLSKSHPSRSCSLCKSCCTYPRTSRTFQSFAIKERYLKGHS